MLNVPALCQSSVAVGYGTAPRLELRARRNDGLADDRDCLDALGEFPGPIPEAIVNAREACTRE